MKPTTVDRPRDAGVGRRVVGSRPIGLVQTMAAQAGGSDGASDAAVSGRPGLAEAPEQMGARTREQRGG